MDMLSIRQLARGAFTFTIAAYYQNDSRTFTVGFEEQYPDICRSIHSVVVLTEPDRLV